MVAIKIPGSESIDPVAPARDPGVQATPDEFGAAIGASAKNFGDSLVSLGAHLYQKREEATDKVAAAAFETEFAPKAAKAYLDAQTKNPTGGDRLTQDVGVSLQTAKDDALQTLQARGIQPSERALGAINTHAAGVSSHYLTNSVALGHNIQVAGLQTTLDDSAKVAASSVLSGNLSLEQGLKQIDTLKSSGVGLYNGPALVAQDEKWRQGVVDAAIENRTRAGDIKGREELRNKFYGAVPTFHTGEAEALAASAARLGINPRDLAAVISYETGGTFNPNKIGGKGNNYMGLIQFGPEERQQYGVTPGQSFTDQLPAVEAYLKDRGLKPGMGLPEIYTIVNAGSLNNGQVRWNASDGNGSIRDHVARIQSQHYPAGDKFLSGGVQADGDNAPALPNVTKSLYWTQQFKAADSDHERELRIQKVQQQNVSDQTENGLLQDLYSEQPSATVRSIVNDDRLTREAKERMIGVAQRAQAGEPLSTISHDTSIKLLDRIRRPDGDPQKMTDINPIFQEYVDGKLNRADFGFLRKEFTDLRTPEGEALGKRKAQFIKGITGAITKSNPLQGHIDQPGDQQLYEFEFAMDEKIADARKNGKNPYDLFDPSKPEYLGRPEALLPYQKTMQQSIADRARMITGAPKPPANPPPADGARLAPDGNWYIQKDGKYFKVVNNAT